MTSFNQGRTFVEQGRYPEAIAAFTKALELNPKFAPAFNWRGLAKRRINDDDGALADYQKALDKDPANLETAKQVEALISKMTLATQTKTGAPKTVLKKTGTSAKPRLRRIDQPDQMETMDFRKPSRTRSFLVNPL